MPSVHGFALLRAGQCGWFDPDGPGFDARTEQDATTNEHGEGADSCWLSLSLVVVQPVVRRHMRAVQASLAVYSA